MWRAIGALLRADICIVDFSDRIHSAANSYASLRARKSESDEEIGAVKREDSLDSSPFDR